MDHVLWVNISKYSEMDSLLITQVNEISPDMIFLSLINFESEPHSLEWVEEYGLSLPFQGPIGILGT